MPAPTNKDCQQITECVESTEKGSLTGLTMSFFYIPQRSTLVFLGGQLKETHGFFWPVAGCVGVVFLQLFVSALSSSYCMHQLLVVLVCPAEPAELKRATDSGGGKNYTAGTVFTSRLKRWVGLRMHLELCNRSWAARGVLQVSRLPS